MVVSINHVVLCPRLIGATANEKVVCYYMLSVRYSNN